MTIAVIAFQLLLEAKVSEISIGPIKLQDASMAISLIPIIFAFAFYQYYTVFFDLAKQRNAYEILSSELFGIEPKSTLIRLIKHYSFTEFISTHHTEEKSKYLGCIVNIIWLPTILAIMVFPFFFEFYAIHKLYVIFGLNSFKEWLFFIAPILLGILTILILIQFVKKEIEYLKV